MSKPDIWKIACRVVRRLLRAQRGLVLAVLVLAASGPIATAQAEDPACTLRPDPAAPSAPANVHVVSWIHVPDVAVYTHVSPEPTGLKFTRTLFVDGAYKCREITLVKWEDVWDNAESQDIVRKIVSVDRLAALPTGSPSVADPSAARASLPDSVFIVTLGNSRFNNDTALFIAAGKVTRNPAKIAWKKFRIQLTKAATDTHFCTPSDTATVLQPRIGVSPSGRLFVVFDSFEGATRTGSILSFDIPSLLRGGPAEFKCFTGEELVDLAPPDVRDDNRNAYFVSASKVDGVPFAKRFRLKIAGNVANDTLTATPNINIPDFNANPPAVQPNGFLLGSGGFAFQTPSIQIGNALWNVHQIGDGGGHAKVRLYKFGTAETDPLMTLTLGTLPDQSDDLFAPSLAIDGTDAFVTFTRTIASNANKGLATLMMARGPHSSTSGWTSTVLEKSPGQYTKNFLGTPCDAFLGFCQYGPNSATVIDPVHNLVWGFGQIITNGTLGTGGQGNEVNWVVKGIGVPR